MPKPENAHEPVPKCTLPSNFASRRRLREEVVGGARPRAGRRPRDITFEGQPMNLRAWSLKVGDEIINP